LIICGIVIGTFVSKNSNYNKKENNNMDDDIYEYFVDEMDEKEFDTIFKKIFGLKASIERIPISAKLKYEKYKKDGIIGANEGVLLYDDNNNS